MDKQNTQKLKNTLQEIPLGYFVDTSWLKDHGIGRASLHDYAKRGWMEHIERGLYRRPLPSNFTDQAIDWKVLLRSMQYLMQLPIHVGGMSALRLRGHGHYLQIGKQGSVSLYSSKMPHWLSKIETDAPLILKKNTLFKNCELGVGDVLADTKTGQTLWWERPVISSSNERAILEAIDELPDKETFHIVDMAFQSLVNLRPRKITALLKDCKKIQVKRLFFVFADRHNHAWRKHVDEKQIDLGNGDRSLVKGGKLHPKYRMTVPAEYVEKTNEVDDGA
ncbi:type IV toxin-antitoxin system AbiEi family antitoxin domain-containing protein [Pseudovibrio ascidiaceicola]|uniref:type IV toxin-antitoxin system AbiEi family antitoxin domain-containing protein n=1 Tax=Pseudovibrio ascidiaceicola TaxID=285279 RepID=UPI003D366BF2